MATELSYTQARANLAKLLDRATEEREIIVIQRRGKADAALIAADELDSLVETAYLLRAPANAQRLLTALNRALQNEGQTTPLDDLRKKVGLGD